MPRRSGENPYKSTLSARRTASPASMLARSSEGRREEAAGIVEASEGLNRRPGTAWAAAPARLGEALAPRRGRRGDASPIHPALIAGAPRGGSRGQERRPSATLRSRRRRFFVDSRPSSRRPTHATRKRAPRRGGAAGMEERKKNAGLPGSPRPEVGDAEGRLTRNPLEGASRPPGSGDHIDRAATVPNRCEVHALSTHCQRSLGPHSPGP